MYSKVSDLSATLSNSLTANLLLLIIQPKVMVKIASAPTEEFIMQKALRKPGIEPGPLMDKNLQNFETF